MRANYPLHGPPLRLVAEAKPWLDNLKARNLSPNTIKCSEKALRQLARYLLAQNQSQSCRDIRSDNLEGWLRSLFESKLKIASIHSAWNPVRLYCQWLVERGLIFDNPTRGLTLPRYYRPLQPVPTEAQMRLLLESVPTKRATGMRDLAILEVAYASGLRKHELAGLDLDSVDLVHRTVRTIGKGKRERVVPLTKAAVEAVQAYIKAARPRLLGMKKDHPALWLERIAGCRLSLCGIEKSITFRARAVGLHITARSIRRAVATHLLQHGATPIELKFFLGHTTFRHLRHYLRYSPEELRKIHRNSRLGL